ncbi:MAG: PQQ-like beta-propeller repeat protein [Planctomycetaceae bacterium]|nr:PQQ-like beta-propeller repeat protein [Planctomycetaceae bacterium]
MKTSLPLAFAALVMLSLASAASGQADVRPQRPSLDMMPAAWYQFPVAWKATWDETLEANKDALAPAAVKDPALAAMAQNIVQYRKVWLLEAMLGRFAADRANCIKGHAELAEAWQRVGLQYARSWWGLKLLTDYGDDAEAVKKGYQLALGWGWGQYIHWGTWVYAIQPECRDYAWLIDDIIAKNRSGKLPDDHPAVTMAYSYQSWLTSDLLRYDEFHPFLATLRAKGARVPSYQQEALDLLQRFGHIPPEKDAAAKPAAESDLGTASIIDADGSIRDLRPDFEVQTRWDLLYKNGPLAPGSSEALAVEDVQKVLDLIVNSLAHLKNGNRYAPFWTVVDRRLRELPAQRLAPLRESHERMGKSVAQAAVMAADKHMLLRAFSQYPFSASIHRAMVDLAEAELPTGRTQWAMAAYEDVIAHASDPQIAAQARAGLWLALSQSRLYRSRLVKAMAAVGDDVQMPWRGQTVAAAQIKRELLTEPRAVTSAAAVAKPAPATLAQLPRRKIALPGDWPALYFDLGGPHMAWGVRNPWPVPAVEFSPDATIVACARAVARFDAAADSDQPAWTRTPPDLARGSWPFNISVSRAHGMGDSTFHPFFMQRSPVRITSAANASRGARYYLMDTAAPPVVTAVDVRSGKVLWSTQGKTGWKGLTPLTHPAAAEGRVYVLAGPETVERLAALGFNDEIRVVQQLVCLDGADGEMIWRRPVGWAPNSSIDLARGGGAVTIHEGSIYSATNMGVLSRCDAQDGLTEWVARYPAARQYSNVLSMNCAREGSSPLVIGERVLLAPRDHSGMLAFRRDKGDLLWESVLVPSDKLVGAAGSVVIGANTTWLTGLDIETGKQLWVREFPAGIASQAAILNNESVVVVSAGRALRLAAATGKTLEELDLQGAAGAEFVIGPDGTLAEVAPAPVAGAKGPATVGLPLQLPLKKVWSLACDSPVLALPDGADASTESIGLLTQRRIGLIRTRPNWELTWQRLLTNRPVTIALAGQRLLAARLWTLDAYDSAGKGQWSMQLPNIPATIGGDDRLIYSLPSGGNGGSSLYAGADAAVGKVLWHYSLNWSAQFGAGTFAHAFRRGGDGSATLNSVVNGPGVVCEVVQDPASGKIVSHRPICPPNTWAWGEYTYDEAGIGWIGSDKRIRAVGLTGEGLLTQGWAREVEFKYFRPLVNVRREGVYLRLTQNLLRYDPATRAEVTYDLAPGEQAPNRMVLEFRKLGERLLVVSGDNVRGADGGVFADIFDYTSGRRLAHQTLPDVRCCVSIFSRNVASGFDTRAIILDGSIVITDTEGVYIFAHPAVAASS